MHRRLVLRPEDGWLRAWVFAHARVLADEVRETGGWDMEVMVPRQSLDRLLHRKSTLASRFSLPPGSTPGAGGGRTRWRWTAGPEWARSSPYPVSPLECRVRGARYSPRSA